MYEPDISYEEFIKKEQQKYPELNLDDIETLKKKVQANKDINSVRGKINNYLTYINHFPKLVFVLFFLSFFIQRFVNFKHLRFFYFAILIGNI